jgi:hypothetical protein
VDALDPGVKCGDGIGYADDDLIGADEAATRGRRSVVITED